MANPGAFAETLNGAMQGQHGPAGPAFLTWLVGKGGWRRILDRGPASAASPRLPLTEFVPGGVDGQVRSVARRSAVIAIGGELASEAGVTGGLKGVAWASAGACLAACLEARGSSGAREDMEAVRRVAQAIPDARFEVWKDRAPNEGTVATAENTPPHGVRAVMNRLGWRRWLPDVAAPEHALRSRHDIDG